MFISTRLNYVGIKEQLITSKRNVLSAIAAVSIRIINMTCTGKTNLEKIMTTSNVLIKNGPLPDHLDTEWDSYRHKSPEIKKKNLYHYE